MTELHCDLPAGAGLQQQVQLQRQSLQARRRWLEQFLVELSLSRRQPGGCRWAWLPLELWAIVFGYLPWGIYRRMLTHCFEIEAHATEHELSNH